MTAPVDGSYGSDMSLAALTSILMHGPVSRTELTARLGGSQPTMTRAVKPLLDRGLVLETEDQLEGPGRPSRPLVGSPGAQRFVGVKVTGDEVFAVSTDLLAQEIAHTTMALRSHDPVDVAATIAEAVHALASAEELECVGVALGGSAVDGRTVTRAPFLDWRDVPLADMLEPLVAVPVVVDNDITALTAGEHWFGVARGERDFAVVTIGAGVGLGLVRDDRVVRTHDMGLGTAGHVPLDPTGPRCFLGHRGCSTAMLTIPSIESQASVALHRDLTFDEIVALAREGEPVALDILTAAGTSLGRLIAMVANIAMVDVIVISGDGLAVRDIAEEALLTQLAAERDPEATPLDLRIDPEGFTRWARGAATVAIQWSLPRLLAAPAAR